MTEPVAYMWKTVQGTIIGFTPNENSHSGGQLGIPLYTAEQLHQRVKMTKKQYDRLMWDKQNTDLSTCISYFLEHDGVNKFGLSSENLRGDLTQEDIARAWLNPDETIEIVPTKKWFVRSKKRDYDGDYAFLAGIINTNDWIYREQYDDVIGMLYPFDTKEEAEKWTNPLTEAVQLPVEGE
ncbi:hypothetical protein DQM10_06885 [Leuconostoc mesenteroides subsp. mesenteroides]|uniref:hypothetical protein n=1 Tax=Leuconostoc mesenteroides TaxID=1245 RepID=UPI000E08F6EE|nr:hypothetical protein [Leuconostoc mesenteroides]RDF88659.1 hypothetical protein DQM10_06885 [Leuconostoc mesenteroides subsp. mesenteroides]